MKPIVQFFRIALFTGLLAGAVLTAQARLASEPEPVHCINSFTIYFFKPAPPNGAEAEATRTTGPPGPWHAVLTGPIYTEGCKPAS
jgi:hypothetical protein